MSPTNPPPDQTPHVGQAWLTQHGDALFRYALLHVGNHSAAEDLVQETLLAALKSHDNFQRRASERTWLVGILRHKISDHFRRSGREASATELDATDQAVADHFTAAGLWAVKLQRWKQDPDQALETQEFWDVLTECLKRLPHRLLLAFTARELDDRESAEICKDLDVTPTNLWTLLHRARTRLRTCLDKNWFGAKSRPRKA